MVSVIEKIFVPNHFPTAIFCCSDEVAIELMCWLMHHGYKIPEDVSVLSFDGIPYTEKAESFNDYNLSAGRISGRKNHKWNVISAGWKRAKK